MEPKGIKYWVTVNGQTIIKADAPDWAKKEFLAYQQMLRSEQDKRRVI
ncbi:hypothetical protein [Lentilactobacillus senioris]|nr:hypothetical protein [Lentilactobacillus senioris]MCY9806996.1 hypothetical protein [Lentilactobacillus senioris]